MESGLRRVFRGRYRNENGEILIQAFTEGYNLYYMEAISVISYTYSKIRIVDFKIGTDKWDIIDFEKEVKENFSLETIKEIWDRDFLNKWKKGRI